MLCSAYIVVAFATLCGLSAAAAVPALLYPREEAVLFLLADIIQLQVLVTAVNVTNIGLIPNNPIAVAAFLIAMTAFTGRMSLAHAAFNGTMPFIAADASLVYDFYASFAQLTQSTLRTNLAAVSLYGTNATGINTTASNLIQASLVNAQSSYRDFFLNSTSGFLDDFKVNNTLYTNTQIMTESTVVLFRDAACAWDINPTQCLL